MAITDKYVSATATGSGDGSSEASPWTLAQAVSSMASGQRVNIKKGTYALSSSLDPSTNGVAYRPILWRGYDTTPGDLDDKLSENITGTLSDSMPVIETNGNSVILDADFHNLIGLCFKNTVGNRPALYDRSKYGWRKNCKFLQDYSNSTNAAIDIGQDDHRTYLNCEFAAKGDANNSNDYAAKVARYGMQFHFCYFHANGVSSSSTNSLVSNTQRFNVFNKCVFEGGSTQLQTGSTDVTVIDCVFHNAGADAIQVTGGSANQYNGSNIVNCTFSEVTDYAIGNTSTSLAYANSGIGVFNNAYYDVANKFENMPDTQEYDDVSDTASPFEDAAAGNFAIKSDSNAYSLGLGHHITLDSENFSDPSPAQNAGPPASSTPEEAGTQVFPFNQWVTPAVPEAILHPLRSS